MTGPNHRTDIYQRNPFNFSGPTVFVSTVGINSQQAPDIHQLPRARKRHSVGERRGAAKMTSTRRTCATADLFSRRQWKGQCKMMMEPRGPTDVFLKSAPSRRLQQLAARIAACRSGGP